MSITLSTEQQYVKNGIISYLFGGNVKKPLIVTGPAGTGKTLLMSKVAEEIHNVRKISEARIAFVSFTGKAAANIRKRLINEDYRYIEDDSISTIHSLLYRPIIQTINGRQVIVGWERKSELTADYILVDEASMVSIQLLKDMMYYKLPIVMFGDSFQLPPVGEENQILANPHYTIQEVHRQALTSPILALANYVRLNGVLKNLVHSNDVIRIPWDMPDCKRIFNNIEPDNQTIFLCGFNKTRVKLNDDVRTKLKFRKEIPYPGDRVVCLRNNYESGIFNGQLGTIVWCLPGEFEQYKMVIDMDDTHNVGFYEGIVSEKFFNCDDYTKKMEEILEKNDDVSPWKTKESKKIDFFDYGYALSVHKSQGSEWNRVVLFEQRSNHWDDIYFARWLYTGITRAVKKLLIISDAWI
jgi:exodeoxyribonuclease V